MQPITLASTECCVLRLAAHANPSFVEEYATTENPTLVDVCVNILENTHRMGCNSNGPNDSVPCFYHPLTPLQP